MFVLRASPPSSFSLAPNATAPPSSPSSLLLLSGVSYSAVVGGTFDATGNETYEAIRIEDGTHNSVRGVTASSHVFELWKSTVTIRGGTRNALSHSLIDGGSKAGRCAWTIATSFAMVHDNTIQACVGHVLDLDAYTSSSAAYNNLIRDTGAGNAAGGGQAIFVEETAQGNFVFNNTLRNNFNGIAVYSLTVGPVSGNIIANNVVEKTVNIGVSSGGGDANYTNHAENNVFVGNKVSGSGEADCQVMHGHVVGDYWVENEAGDGGELVWMGTEGYANPTSKNVTVFDP